MNPDRLQHRIVAVLVVAAILRLAALVVWHDNLKQDRDGYAGIARMLAAGQGYADPGTGRPTAFRPPLYPLILAGRLRITDGTAAVAAVHLLFGVATVWMTARLAANLGMPSRAWIAALIVAVDPMLIQYGTFVMTETLCALLVTLLVLVCCWPLTPSRQSGRVRCLAIGAVFGLNVLCRPTVWAFGILSAGGWLIRSCAESAVPYAGTARNRQAALCLTGAAIVVIPWVVRNTVVLGQPIVMTTHGGYTDLLGNNPVFHREVVSAPWGTVWSGDSLARWQAQLEREMQQVGVDRKNEIARDRWFQERANRFREQNPAAFVRACWLRVRRFWNIVPLKPSRGSLPDFVVLGIGAFYLLVLSGFVVFLVRAKWWRDWNCLILLLMIAGFAAVHVVYWTNMRMRAPVTPLLAVLSIAGWSSLRYPTDRSPEG